MQKTNKHRKPNVTVFTKSSLCKNFFIEISSPHWVDNDMMVQVNMSDKCAVCWVTVTRTVQMPAALAAAVREGSVSRCVSSCTRGTAPVSRREPPSQASPDSAVSSSPAAR